MQTNTNEMQRLSELRSAALKKMILGYIFVVVALIVEGTGIVLAPMAFYDSVYGVISIVMIILALPFLGVGTPFAIIGTIRLIKANREISLLRMEERKNGKTILLAQMNKNKKFQKDQLGKEGYTEFKEFYKEALK